MTKVLKAVAISLADYMKGEGVSRGVVADVSGPPESYVLLVAKNWDQAMRLLDALQEHVFRPYLKGIRVPGYTHFEPAFDEQGERTRKELCEETWAVRIPAKALGSLERETDSSVQIYARVKDVSTLAHCLKSSWDQPYAPLKNGEKPEGERPAVGTAPEP